jgi:hypothetical protein
MRAYLTCFFALSYSAVVQAQTENSIDEAQLQSRPSVVRFGAETIRLPERESMGLVGGSYLLQVAPNIYVGPSAYGANTGKRGGFFTGGGDLMWRQRVGSKLDLSAGMYVGGGGGGAAAVGGGLMLRPYIDLSWQFERASVGISASRVQFPNGKISSQQLGVVASFNDAFIYAAPEHIGKSIFTRKRGGVGFDRIQIIGGSYQPSASAATVSGERYTQSIGYAGFRAEQMLTSTLFWGIESGAAVHGGADGYAEILGTVGAEFPVTDETFKVGARLATGLGGGGKIATGGGTINKVAVFGRIQISDSAFIGIEAGKASALKGADLGKFNANFVTVQLGIHLDAPTTSNQARVLRGSEWGGKFTRYLNAKRYGGNAQSFDTVGLAINRNIFSAKNEGALYFSGQALSAVDGKAGGFSIGLVGLGINSSKTKQGFSAGFEGLAGAAGGGGVDTQGGAIAQGIVYANLDLNNGARIKLGVGRVHSFKGAFRTPALDLTVSVPFAVAGK